MPRFAFSGFSTTLKTLIVAFVLPRTCKPHEQTMICPCILLRLLAARMRIVDASWVSKAAGPTDPYGMMDTSYARLPSSQSLCAGSERLQGTNYTISIFRVFHNPENANRGIRPPQSLRACGSGNLCICVALGGSPSTPSPPGQEPTIEALQAGQPWPPGMEPRASSGRHAQQISKVLKLSCTSLAMAHLAHAGLEGARFPPKTQARAVVNTDIIQLNTDASGVASISVKITGPGPIMVYVGGRWR